jgi:hypothetical protein
MAIAADTVDITEAMAVDTMAATLREPVAVDSTVEADSMAVEEASMVEADSTAVVATAADIDKRSTEMKLESPGASASGLLF